MELQLNVGSLSSDEGQCIGYTITLDLKCGHWNEQISVSVGRWINTGRFIMFFVITNIYNKKTKGPTLMEFFTATGKLKKFFFW